MMWWVDVLVGLTCGAVILVPTPSTAAHAVQTPLGAHHDIPLDFGYDELVDWRLDEPPDANATGNLIFETASSLLQFWPNTRYRNGHTIVPGVVRPGTLLYHGTSKQEVPSVPEWTATDPEHSLAFCQGRTETGCWHLTLAATRPLQVLYFDGSSASKLQGNQGGSMDSQDIITWGEPKPEWLYKERERIAALCEWGQQYGLDGFARMQMDFEIMLCNFTAGVEVVTFANLASLKIGPPQDGRPNYKHIMFRATEIIHSSSWHYRYPGETRVQLDLARLVSFYDTALFPSLVSQRAGQERWDHRLLGISAADSAALMKRLDETLSKQDQTNSGVDWPTLFRVIIDRHADRLDLLRDLLADTSTVMDSDELYRQARVIQLQLRVIVTPYALHSATPPNSSMLQQVGTSWAKPVFRGCATAHTTVISSLLSGQMTPSERLLLDAVQQTTRELCRVMVKMWAKGVMNGLDEYLWLDDREGDLPRAVVEGILQDWRTELDGLMTWLDWSVWIKCRPSCGPKRCYIPTWPFGFPSDKLPMSFPAPELQQPQTLEQFMHLQTGTNFADWERPQPKCIRRVQPYAGF
ncbi:hypothetical protein BV22DRAFT_216800 [Leucogyrophana mollusca]|uniref:Uncharacterized protein n=1 Tax=Leucogyrophana mollusca TaxID=85980 RepID=A0ACB8BRY8_9AGAM|nr:hypothetical protein BV22DRAFT_216800 [Leucogyrophana mollusca]